MYGLVRVPAVGVYVGAKADNEVVTDMQVRAGVKVVLLPVVAAVVGGAPDRAGVVAEGLRAGHGLPAPSSTYRGGPRR